MRECISSEALRIYDPERDHDARFRFGARISAQQRAAYLAQTNWYLGEISRAIELIEEFRRAGDRILRRSNAVFDPPTTSKDDGTDSAW